MSCASWPIDDVGEHVTVAVVTVTYGERWELLEQVLKGLQAQRTPVNGVVVVGNGIAYDLAARLAPFQQAGLRIEHVASPENRGSAAGYAMGMHRAATLDFELLWLLDDDNVPRPDALEMLLLARQLLGENPLHLFASLRLDREKHLQVVHGDTALTLGPVDSFMSFRVTGIPRMLFNRLRRNRPAVSGTLRSPLKRIEYAVYGGLLLLRSWLDRVGGPDERYVLYIDDREFTTRICRAGGAIYLVGTSLVEDVDRSWHVQAKQRRVPQLFDSQHSETRAFYTVRNLVHYDLRYTVRWRARYLLNVHAYLLLQAALALLRNVPPRLVARRLRLLRAAVTDGLAGKLGPRRS